MNPEFKEWLEKNKSLIIGVFLFSLIWFKWNCNENKSKTINSNQDANSVLNSNSSSSISENSVLGITYKIDNLEIAQYVFPKAMIWDDAKKACEALGDGWRLPTKKELNTLYKKHRGTLGGFEEENTYWSSTYGGEYGDDCAWGQFFYDGSQSCYDKFFPLKFRAVRTL